MFVPEHHNSVEVQINIVYIISLLVPYLVSYLFSFSFVVFSDWFPGHGDLTEPDVQEGW